MSVSRRSCSALTACSHARRKALNALKRARRAADIDTVPALADVVPAIGA